MNLHILSYNIHKGIGWKTVPTTIHRIQTQIQKLYCDIVFFQEMHRNHLKLFKNDDYQYHSYGINASHKNAIYGNAILSQHPITFSKNISLSMHRFENRGLLHSIIKPQNSDISLNLLCTHLGLFAKDRRDQIDIIVKYINENIDKHEPLILGGDFNDWRGYLNNPLIKTLELQEAFLSANNSYARTFPAWSPILKLDRIYFRGFNVNYANRMANKSWRSLSDHIAIDVSLNLIA